jgi:hypothetical protein
VLEQLLRKTVLTAYGNGWQSSSPHLWNCLGNCVLLLGQLCLTAWATVSYCLWKWLARSFPAYGNGWQSSSPHLWNCLGNYVLLLGQLCLTTWATVSYCLGNCVLLLGQLCLTAWATVSYCLWKWLARSFPVYGNGFRSCTSENQRLHKELSNSKNRVTYRLR